MVYHRILNIGPCACVSSSLYAIAYPSPAPFRLATATVLCPWFSFCFIDRFICIISQVPHLSDIRWLLSLSDLLHLLRSSLVAPTLQQMALFHSFLFVVSSLSYVQLFETPWTAPHQASLSFTSPRVYSNSCPLSQWRHPSISFSVAPFSSFPQSFPASGSFPMSQLFASGGQSTEVSASTSVFPMNIQDWFPLGLDWFDILAVQETLKSLLLFLLILWIKWILPYLSQHLGEDIIFLMVHQSLEVHSHCLLLLYADMCSSLPYLLN